MSRSQAAHGDPLNIARLTDLQLDLTAALAPTRDNEFPVTKLLAENLLGLILCAGAGASYDGEGFRRLTQAAMDEINPYLPLGGVGDCSDLAGGIGPDLAGPSM